MKKAIPKGAIDRKDQKKIRTTPQPLDDKPVWRFSTVDKDGPFKWPKGESEELTIVAKLHDFDSMSWGEIEGSKHHFLSQESLSKEAKQRLEVISLDDEIDNLFSFHLSGKPRIIAIKHNNVARLLWFDPLHGVAPSSKKHT